METLACGTAGGVVGDVAAVNGCSEREAGFAQQANRDGTIGFARRAVKGCSRPAGAGVDRGAMLAAETSGLTNVASVATVSMRRIN